MNGCFVEHERLVAVAIDYTDGTGASSLVDALFSTAYQHRHDNSARHYYDADFNSAENHEDIEGHENDEDHEADEDHEDNEEREQRRTCRLRTLIVSLRGVERSLNVVDEPRLVRGARRAARIWSRCAARGLLVLVVARAMFDERSRIERWSREWQRALAAARRVALVVDERDRSDGDARAIGAAEFGALDRWHACAALRFDVRFAVNVRSRRAAQAFWRRALSPLFDNNE